MRAQNSPNDCPELLDRAEPGLYAANPFRVLGVPITVTPADARRSQQRREMQAKLGLLEDDAETAAPELVRAAMERLNEPEQRLIDELFWYWPTNGAEEDPALAAVGTGDLATAAETWQALANQGESGVVALHNLAVLHHMRALDGESAADASVQERQQHWRTALEAWAEVHRCDAFWDAVRDRVKALGDQKLTTGYVRRIRECLPEALLLINARLLYAAVKSEDGHARDRHAAVLAAEPFGAEATRRAVKTALRPLRSRLKQMVDHAKSRWTDNAESGRQAVLDLHAQAVPLLDIVDAMVDEHDVVRSGLRDLVAETLLEGEIAWVCKTNDWQAGVPLLAMARELALDGELLARIDRETELRTENAESANDWCASGYWELPPEVLGRLEEIRELARVADYDAAIGELVVLDPEIGLPLRRCLAYCISLKAIGMGNRVLDESNQPVPVLQKIWSKVEHMGAAAALLLRRPDPESASYLNPACPACGTTFYTTWMNFEFKGIPMFFCMSCSHQHDREVEEQKKQLKNGLVESLRWMLLAKEVDPDDPGIERNLRVMRKNLKEHKVGTPDHSQLRAQLASDPLRGVRVDYAAPAGESCFFCGEHPADDGCGVEVPMCGEFKTISMIFGDGLEYEHTDVVVPRCRHCRRTHEELPGAYEKWQEERNKVAAGRHFPELLEAVKLADADLDEATQTARVQRSGRDKAQRKLDSATSLGSRCEECDSDEHWDDQLCRKCDSSLFGLPGRTVAALLLCLLVLPTVVLALLRQDPLAGAILDLTSPTGSLRALDIRVIKMLPIAASLVASIVLVVKGLRRQKETRAHARAERAADFESRREQLSAVAREALNETAGVLATAEAVLADCQELLSKARAALKAAQDEATTAFTRETPSPLDQCDIRHENEYAAYAGLAACRDRGWGFGSRPLNAAGDTRDEPCNAQGLVWREPRIIMPDDDAIGGTRPKTLHDKVRLMAREADDDAMLPCPCCKAEVKARNLMRHFGKLHGDRAKEAMDDDDALDQDVPETVPVSVREEKPEDPDRPSRVCPECGGKISFGATRCWNKACN